jgi:phage terminase large subunit-like protein
MSKQGIFPQEGTQEQFLETSADIAIFGGAAGGGKSWSLLVDGLRHRKVKGFNGVIFRRTTKQIRNTGGLWDSATEIYSGIKGSKLNDSFLTIKYESMKIEFAHLEHEKNKHDWDGTEICYLGFDELQHFTKTQFWYLVGRSRSTCGVKPYVRCTCMADADSWVKDLIIWWLDENGEYADRSKSGVIRWFVRLEDNIYWFDSEKEALKEYPKERPMSITFIPSYVTDNKILMEKDPLYQAKLKAMIKIERERKEKGNWKIRPSAGMFFKRSMFEIIEQSDLPPTRRVVRGWDRAATEVSVKSQNPAWTAGVRISRDNDGYYYIEHVERFRANTGERDKRIKNIALMDTNTVMIGLEQEPGASGKSEVYYMNEFLKGFYVKPVSTGGRDKITRALPMASQAHLGMIKIVRGSWNDAYLSELENFDGDPDPKKKKDQVDASSLGFNLLEGGGVIESTYTAPNPDIQTERKVDVHKDLRGSFDKGRKSLI